MDSKQIKDKFIKFFVGKGHKEIPAAPLVPENDPTTLFTSSGMQSLVPYLLGQEHPEGKRLVNSQPCFRAEDIDEVGDNRHTTFFEMLGNWSLGDYFKKEQLPWFWEFLTEELGLAAEKLYVSVFEGNESVPKDTESYEIWKSLGVAKDHIFFYGVDKNWWSRSGTPDKMPEGEIGGPDSEVFYEFTQLPDNPYAHYYRDCHPNCGCGRFLEIGNSVFIQYQKQEDGTLKELAQKNVDFGGGLERLTAATLNTPDVFQTDLYIPIIRIIEQVTGEKYQDNPEPFRVIADHMKAAIFLIVDGVIPSNKLQGYILRRLIRRSVIKFRQLNTEVDLVQLVKMIQIILTFYDGMFKVNKDEQLGLVRQIIEDEIKRFNTTLNHGLKKLDKYLEENPQINGLHAFDLYQSDGFPPELTIEIVKQRNVKASSDFWKEFENSKEGHSELSRTASAGIFKGGLADHSEVVTKYHTATHLLHQALRDVLGPEVFQKGSNITAERLRFDFSFNRKMTDEEIKQVENIINERIRQDLKVDHMIIPLDEAKKMHAIGLFDEKYAKDVSIYGVGPGYKLDPNAKDRRDRGGYYSLEFCGGPHVAHTGMIGGIKITKEEAVSSGIRRIRAEIMLR